MEPTSHFAVRDFDDPADREALRRCLIGLQDYERKLDPRMPSGTEIADAYVTEMLEHYRIGEAKIFVADNGYSVVGYTCVYPRIVSDEIEDGDMEVALVKDIYVDEPARGQGVGSRLLEAAEEHARSCGAETLRIGALAKNVGSVEVYRKAGFIDYVVQLEKPLM